MRKQFLAALTILSVAISASAGGVGSTTTCTYVNEVLMSAPLQVYLPDGMTEQTVGEASIVSRKGTCTTGAFEVIDISFKLDDEIKPYGIKIKDTITAFEPFAMIDFRLKELVNSTESFHASVYSKTKINHFGQLGILNLTIENPTILFWTNTQSQIDGLMSADSNGQGPNGRPLACSLEKAYVSLTKKASGTDGLKKDLQLTAIFRGPLQFCL